MATNWDKQQEEFTKKLNALGDSPTLAEYDADGKVAQALNNYANYKKFSYDVNADPMYQNYKDQYVRGGKMAMMDTMGEAAALSGGYGNSYAATAGNQAYQQYLSGLNEVIPELYNAAYNRYNTERNNALNLYEVQKAAEDSAYSRSKDAIDAFNTNYNRLYTGQQDAINHGFTQKSLDETVRSNKVSEALEQNKFNYTKEQDAKNFKYQQERDAVADEQFYAQLNANQTGNQAVQENYAKYGFESYIDCAKYFDGLKSDGMSDEQLVKRILDIVPNDEVAAKLIYDEYGLGEAYEKLANE